MRHGRTTRIALCLGLWAFTMAPVTAGDPVRWPMRGADPQNTNVSAYFGVHSRPTFAWSDEPESRYPWFYSGHSHPAVAPDGTIYAGVYYTAAGSYARRGELRALAADGTHLWTANLTNSHGADLWPPFRGTLIGPDGNIYLGWAFEGDSIFPDSLAFLAFDPQGNLLWRYEPDPNLVSQSGTGPIMGPDGTIYIALLRRGDNIGSLLALDSVTGKLRWEWSPRGTPPQKYGAGPALGANGKIYHCTNSFDTGRLVCLDAVTGKLIWEVTEPVFLVSSSPTIDDDGSVYIVEHPSDGQCTKLDENGNVLWVFDTGWGTIRESATLHAGKVYLSARAGPGVDRVFVVDAETGQELGTMVGLSSLGRVTIDAAGVRYFLAGATIVAFSPTGELLWTHYDGGSPSTYRYPVTIGHHGMILQAGPGNSDRLAAYTSAVLEGDLDGDGVVGAVDLLILLTSWGPCPDLPETCPADLDLDGNVGATDLLILLVNWG